MANKKRGISPAALSALAKGDIRNFDVASSPGGIERQEAEGQKELCSNPVFPKEHLSCERKDFEKMGVVYGKDIDELFVEVKLPDKWSIKPTEHSMWNEVINDKEKVIASIFYKAAFYDRRAHIGLKK